jgi:hypothetical protein
MMVGYVQIENLVTLRRRPEPTPNGEDFEWDVTLHPSMRDAMKWLSRSGTHLNVALKGLITH